MKNKIISILLSLALVVTMMPAQSLVVSAATKTKATVSTQTGLRKALKNKKLKSLTIKTTKKKNFTIPNGTYKNVKLYVNAPNSEIKNSGIFKKITIKKLASDTWTELAKNNVLFFDTSKTHVVVSDKAKIKEIRLTKSKSNLTVDVSGNVNKITIAAKTTLDINGSTKDSINVKVLNGTNGTIINSNVKLVINTDANTDINLNKGAEDSIIKTDSELIIINVTNNTNTSVKIINNEGKTNTVNSEVNSIICGNGNMISSSDEKENQNPDIGGGGSGPNSGYTKEQVEASAAAASAEAWRKAREEASAAAAAAAASAEAARQAALSAEAARIAEEFAAYKEAAFNTVSSEATKANTKLESLTLSAEASDNIAATIADIVSSADSAIEAATTKEAINEARDITKARLIAIRTVLGTIKVSKLKKLIISHIVNDIAEIKDATGDAIENKVDEVLEYDGKGVLITLPKVNIDGQEGDDLFRVIKVNGSQVELLAMNGNGNTLEWDENANHKTKFYLDDDGCTEYYGGEQFQQYENSQVDKYLNGSGEGDYYGQLPEAIKKSIIPRENLKQGLYKQLTEQSISGTEGIDYWQGIQYIAFLPSPEEKTYYLSTRAATAPMSKKYVYALDVEDVMDYLGVGNLTYRNLTMMFFGDETQEEPTYCWLRSATSLNNELWSIGRREGCLYNNPCGSAIEARAAFTIDLSKVDYTVVK